MLNQKGMVLATVMIMVLLVMVLTTAGLKMSELGYQAYGSEKKYQMAGWAAEYALNTGVEYIDSNRSCPSTTTGSLTYGGASVSYSYSAVTGGNYCLLYASGSFGGAKVVKYTVVPTSASGNWGALVVNSGTVNLGGSGAVTFCDTSCPGGGPAIMYIGATTVSGTSASTKLPADCQSNEKGPVGYPAVSQNSSLPSDLTSTYFDSDNWSDLESDLRTKYGVDSAAIAAMSSSCKYTGTDTCDTTSTTNIKCGSGGAEVNINLTTCPKVYIQQADLTIDQSLSGKTVYSGAKVTVTGATTNTNVISNTLEINLDGNNVTGGTFFSTSTSSTAAPPTNKVYVKSNATLGSEANPVMLITKGYTLFDSNGGPDIWGLVYTSSNTIDVNGNIVFKGSFIESSTATMTFGGNASIQFDKSVLESLKTNLGSTGTALKSPTCASLALSGSISSTKMTVY